MSLVSATRWVSLALRFLAVFFALIIMYERRTPEMAIIIIAMLQDVIDRK